VYYIAAMNLVGVCTVEPAHDDAPRDSLRHRSQVAVCVGEYAARRRAASGLVRPVTRLDRLAARALREHVTLAVSLAEKVGTCAKGRSPAVQLVP